MEIGLLQNAHLLTIPATENILTTTGFSIVGKGIARYKRMASPPSASDMLWGNNFWYFQTVDGAYWELAENNPTSDMFGTLGDAARATGASSVSGTDVTAIINNALWYCQTRGIKTLILSRGRHRTSDTIHVGRGETFNSISLHGEYERPYSRPDSIFPMAAIIAEKNDRPCINVQGARSSQVYNIACYGPMMGWISDHGLGQGGSFSYPTIRDTRIRDWNPRDGSTTDGQYNPGVAFAMDAYSGTQPGTSGIAPAWAASTAYVEGDGRTNGGNLYQCVKAGTSASSGGPGGTGNDIADGTAEWDYIGASSTLISYPVPTHPSYTGVASGWGKSNSSDVTFRNCHSLGFACGFVSHPSGSDGNGDYLRLQNCTATYTTIGLSICNSQSRAVEVSNFNQVFSHTVFTNVNHGKRAGKFGGHITNFEGGHWIRLFNYGAGSGGNLVFRNCHWEAAWRLGDLTGDASDVIFEGCDMNMGDSVGTGSAMRGLPVNMIGVSNDSGATVNLGVVMRDCNLQTTHVFPICSRQVRISGGYMFARARDNSTNKPYMAQAHNATNGGLFAPTHEGGVGTLVNAAFYPISVDTGTRGGPVLPWDGTKWSALRTYGTPVYAKRLGYALNYNNSLAHEMPAVVLGQSYFTKTLTGRVLTLNTGGGWISHGEHFNLKPGDVIYHDVTGLLFFIFSFDGTEIKAQVMNGFKDVSGTITFPSLGTPNFNAGVFAFYSGRRHVTRDNVTATLTSGSATATDVKDGLGNSFNIATDIPVGDALYVDEVDDRVVNQYNQVTTAGSASAHTFTLNQNALKSEVIRPVFRRNIANDSTP